mmetsp:Transcript_26189/g.104760  ORF Transcript_26189/g.104760 Transcript_26189/m.104760 type:complete len:269 (-) Transcript_26189:1669-2475(-)
MGARLGLLGGASMTTTTAAAATLSKVTFGQNVPGLIGGPLGAPAVIVIQEWWGLTPQVEAHALKIANEGYRVLVPDIYKGAIGVTAEEAHHMMENLDFPGAVEEIKQAAAYLRAAEASPAVGVCGFCMGGALTLGAAAKSEDIVAAAPFYGANFGLFDAKDFAGKSVQGHFGEKDALEGFADPATAKKLEDTLKPTAAEVQVFVYPGVGHAFMNESPKPYESFDERQKTMGFPPYDKVQADLAWSRLFAFFEKTVKQQQSPSAAKGDL